MELRAQLKQLQSEGAAPPASYAGAAPAPAADGMHARVPQPPVEPPPEPARLAEGRSKGRQAAAQTGSRQEFSQF